MCISMYHISVTYGQFCGSYAHFELRSLAHIENTILTETDFSVKFLWTHWKEFQETLYLICIDRHNV